VTDRYQAHAAVTSLVTAGAVLLIAGCASSQPPGPAAHSSPAAPAAPAAPATPAPAAPATPAPAAPATPAPATPALATPDAAVLRALAARYLAIAQPANRQLDHDFDGLKDHEGDDLAAAEADLRAAAATEQRFDRQLIAITFAPQTEPIVRLLVNVNQARAGLSTMAAAAMSLPQLRGYQARLDAANEPVEEAVWVIRSQLGLPPPDTS
jgi:hypothetical protein